MSELPLLGCTPEPLMNYLKALGIVRLVTEQADPAARGAWRDGTFVLRSKFDREALERFFLNDYCPTPIVAPWGARSGFYPSSSEKTARVALQTISKTKDKRFEQFRQTIATVQGLLRGMRLTKKAKEEDKLALMRACRAKLPDELLEWLDACYVLTADDRAYPPLLGTGGNEGSGSYVSGFAQQVVACLIERAHDSALGTALSGDARRGVHSDQTPGHFSPSASGGPNATQAMERDVATNPFDYLLCLEGACLWASGVVRRFGQKGGGMAAFPFVVNVSGSGAGSLAASDSRKPAQAKRPIAEMWLPLWRRFIGLKELKALLAEGRATIGRRTAVTGVDMARAVAGLGVDRGIDSFQRIAFLMRHGQSFLAVPLGEFEVQGRAPIDLLREADGWLEGFRRACANPNVPRRLTAALQRTERAIFDYCRYGGTPLFAEILCALGAAERELAVREGKISGDDACHPLGGLSPDWLAAAHDGSTEFELALSLAGIYDGENKLGPLRANLEPFDWQKPYPDWAEKNRTAVWNSADLTTNLAAVLERRLLDGERSGCESLPLNFKRAASLEAIAAFLSTDGVNDRRLDELLWGLTLVDHRQEYPQVARVRPDAPSLPRAYALVKLLFLPYPLVRKRQEHGRAIWRLATGDEPDAVHIWPEPQILPVLRSRRPDSIPEACTLAMRRLRLSGLKPLPYRTGGGRNRDDAWASAHGVDPKRLAAALLFPVSSAAINELIQLVTRRDEELEPVTQAEGENEL